MLKINNKWKKKGMCKVCGQIDDLMRTKRCQETINAIIPSVKKASFTEES